MSDTPLRVIECAGDPRAMGKAQGLAFRTAIEARLAEARIARRGRSRASLRPFASGGVLGQGRGREIARHYPHLCERVQGLARGSGRSIDEMMELLLGASDRSLPADPAAFESAAAARAGDDPLLARRLIAEDASSCQWIARHSRPEVGFASVELTLPWLVAAVAGVNAAGVAALLSPGVGSTRPPEIGSVKPPPLLLVQECLQRFDDVAGCIDWLLKRPVAGSGSIVVGDASGAVAAVEVVGEERRIVSPARGALVTAGDEREQAGLRESLAPGAMPDAVGAAIGAGVVLLPAEGRMRVRLLADGPEENLCVGAASPS